MAEAFQVLSDCPTCHVESALLEIYDPDILPGVPLESRCRVCGSLSEAGTLIREGVRFASANGARAALRRWALEEGEADLEEFCAGSLCGLSIEEACHRLLRGEPIETSFDVIAFLFPGMGGGMGAVEAAPAEIPDPAQRARLQPAPAARPAEPPAPPRVLARALAAVMMADGIAHPSERRFIAARLSEAGQPDLAEDELRSWRPGDLGWPYTPGPIIESMARLAHVDGQRDRSEWRVVREFARHWGQPLKPLEALGARLAIEIETPFQRLWRLARGLVITQERA
ncbi:MAG: hypothetical protein ACI8S6_003454 [Myxococcota bacterium]|jgi:hypothetical protein